MEQARLAELLAELLREVGVVNGVVFTLCLIALITVPVVVTDHIRARREKLKNKEISGAYNRLIEMLEHRDITHHQDSITHYLDLITMFREMMEKMDAMIRKYYNVLDADRVESIVTPLFRNMEVRIAQHAVDIIHKNDLLNTRDVVEAKVLAELKVQFSLVRKTLSKFKDMGSVVLSQYLKDEWMQSTYKGVLSIMYDTRLNSDTKKRNLASYLEVTFDEYICEVLRKISQV